MVDWAATNALRDELQSERGELPFFERGPGYKRLSGRDHAEVDRL
jgi:N-methylhydantoinase B